MKNRHQPRTSIDSIVHYSVQIGCIIFLLLVLRECAGLIGIDDRFHSAEGKEAIQRINEQLGIESHTLKNAYYAHYAKGGLPADPNMHYRFEVDRQVLETFINKNKLKTSQTKDEGDRCLPNSGSKTVGGRNIGEWWQPSAIKSDACFRWHRDSTDYYMTFDDLERKTARAYAFSYNY